MNTPVVKLTQLARRFEVTEKDAHDTILKHGNFINIRLLCDIGGAVSVSQETFDEVMRTDRRLLDMVIQEDIVRNNALANILFDKKPRVYFLLSNYEIMYIGQSFNLQSRTTTHLRDKEFDMVASFKVYKDDLNMAEAVNIRHYRPPLNKDVMTDKRYFKKVLQNSFMVD